ncbi:unnamed protein product [Prorocentrum cordatum]|uniref:Pre-mRNA-splicing factor 38 n=1 Tax=Prorocentrum cordatum TaxID=2364126 RepID=A0ABN9VIP8_9DINO|nr:unnamed protein product [Polarella glacialis]
MPDAEDLGEVYAVIDNDSAIVRCVGFLYMRMVIAPSHLWEKLEEYLFDKMELQYADGGKTVTTTIGEYVESLLIKDKYFNSPLPRIPVKVRQTLDKELAPLAQYRKRMDANRVTFREVKIKDAPVEAVVDGRWVSGRAKELVGRRVARKVRVQLDDGGEVTVHLGKVVLREERSKSRSCSRSGSRERRRSRSRSNRREPDWSRYKGKSDKQMVDEMREKAKEEAVCGTGQVYAKRPKAADFYMAMQTGGPTHESRLIEEDRGAHIRRPRPEHKSQEEQELDKRLATQKEEDRQRNMRSIYEKYGSAGKTAAQKASTPSASWNDVDKPDTLRLG